MRIFAEYYSKLFASWSNEQESLNFVKKGVDAARSNTHNAPRNADKVTQKMAT